MTANAEKQRAYRDRKRGAPARDPQPCGEMGAVRRHQRADEDLDEACAQVFREYKTAAQRKHRAKKKAQNAQRPLA